MVHVQLRTIFIGGPSVQLRLLHLIERLNLYEALRIKGAAGKLIHSNVIPHLSFIQVHIVPILVQNGLFDLM